MPVTRCICHNISFQKILQIAREQNIKSIKELQIQRICCTNCKLCVPYVLKALETGIVSFGPETV